MDTLVRFVRKVFGQSDKRIESDIAIESSKRNCYNESTSGAVTGSNYLLHTDGCTRGSRTCTHNPVRECNCADKECAEYDNSDRENKHSWAGPCVVVGCTEQASDPAVQLTADTGIKTRTTITGTSASTTLDGYIRSKAY